MPAKRLLVFLNFIFWFACYTSNPAFAQETRVSVLESTLTASGFSVKKSHGNMVATHNGSSSKVLIVLPNTPKSRGVAVQVVKQLHESSDLAGAYLSFLFLAQDQRDGKLFVDLAKDHDFVLIPLDPDRWVIGVTQASELAEVVEDASFLELSVLVAVTRFYLNLGC